MGSTITHICRTYHAVALRRLLHRLMVLIASLVMHCSGLYITIRRLICILISVLFNIRSRWSGGDRALLLYMVLPVLLLYRLFLTHLLSGLRLFILLYLILTLLIRLLVTTILIRLCSTLETFNKIRDAAGKQD